MKFQPELGEPTLMRWAQRTSFPRIAASLPFLIVMVFIAVEIIFASTQQLTGWPHAVCLELRSFDSHLLLPRACSHGEVQPSFPFARDIFSALTLLIIGVTPLLISQQWSGYRELHDHMVTAKSMAFIDAAAASRFRNQIVKANHRFRLVAKVSPIVLVVMLGNILLLMYLTKQQGPFNALAPHGSARVHWLTMAYDNWWANPTNNMLGSITYLLAGTYGLYIITVQNLVGLIVIWSYWARRKDVAFAADYLNVDDYYGWSPVRRVLSATYAEIALHGVAMAAVAVTLPQRVLIGPFAVAAVQWLVTLPIYLLFPFFFTRRKIAQYKEREIERLHQEAVSVPPGLTPEAVIERERVYSERIALVRSVPVLPFRRLKDVGIFALGFVADASAVVALIALVLGR